MDPDNGQPAQGTPPPPPVGWAQPAPAVVPGAPGFVYGDVPNRIFALIIDAIVLILIEVVVAIVLGVVGVSAGFIAGGGSGDFGAGTIVFGVLAIVVNAAYFIYFWTRSRATPGMRMLGLQVGNAFDGKTLTQDQAIRRALALWGPSLVAQVFSRIIGIGGILGLLAFLWVIYLLYTTSKSPTKQGWHDIFANSVVVKSTRTV